MTRIERKEKYWKSLKAIVSREEYIEYIIKHAKRLYPDIKYVPADKNGNYKLECPSCGFRSSLNHGWVGLEDDRERYAHIYSSYCVSGSFYRLGHKNASDLIVNYRTCQHVEKYIMVF